MKRMTENAMSYYTVTPDDIKNIVVQGTPTDGLFKYTPSAKFIEVLHDFKSILRIDWSKIAPNIWHIIGAPFSMLYPVNKVGITDEGNVAYAYSAASANKKVNPSFFELDGEYFISWADLYV